MCVSASMSKKIKEKKENKLLDKRLILKPQTSDVSLRRRKTGHIIKNCIKIINCGNGETAYHSMIHWLILHIILSMAPCWFLESVRGLKSKRDIVHSCFIPANPIRLKEHRVSISCISFQDNFCSFSKQLNMMQNLPAQWGKIPLRLDQLHWSTTVPLVVTTWPHFCLEEQRSSSMPDCPCWPPGSHCKQWRCCRRWRRVQRCRWKYRATHPVWPGCSRWSKTQTDVKHRLWFVGSSAVVMCVKSHYNRKCTCTLAERLTLVIVLDSSQIVKPAHSTSPLVWSSTGGWVGSVTDRRAIRYGSLRGTRQESTVKFESNRKEEWTCVWGLLDKERSHHDVRTEGLLCVFMVMYAIIPGITRPSPWCKQDKVLTFATFAVRGCSNAINGVILICLDDHLTLPARGNTIISHWSLSLWGLLIGFSISSRSHTSDSQQKHLKSLTLNSACSLMTCALIFEDNPSC